MNLDTAFDYANGITAGLIVYVTTILGSPEAASFGAAFVVWLASVSFRVALPFIRRKLRPFGLDADREGLRVVSEDDLFAELGERLNVNPLIVSEIFGNLIHDGQRIGVGEITAAAEVLRKLRQDAPDGAALLDVIANGLGMHPDDITADHIRDMAV